MELRFTLKLLHLKLRNWIILVGILIAKTGFGISIEEIAQRDSFEFHSEDTKNKKIENSQAILQSKDKRKVAELFNKTAVYFTNHNELERSIGYFDIAFALFKENKNIKEACVVLNFKATVYYNLFKYEKAIDIFNQSITLRRTVNDKKGIAETYQEMAFVYFNTFRLTQAKYFFRKAIDISTEIQDTSGLSEANYYIGTIFLEDRNYDSTLYFFSKSLTSDKLLKRQKDIISSINNIGVVNFLKKDYNNAIRNFNQAIKTNDSIKSDTKSSAIFFNNIGNVYFEKGDFNKALRYYNKSITIKTKIKDEVGIAISEHNIGNVFRKQSQTNKALDFFTKSIARATKLENTDILSSNYKSLSELYEQTGEDEKAFEFYEKFIRTNYSILLDEDGRQISEFQDDNEKSRKQVLMLSHEIQMQKLFSDYESTIKSKEIKILKGKKKYQRNLILSAFGMLVFLIFVILLVLARYKIKKKASILLENRNKNIEEQNEIIATQAAALELSNMELQKLSIVASETDNAVIIMDANGNFEWVNEGFTRLFGFTFEELTTRISTNMIGPKTPQYIKDKFDFCKNNFETQSYELQSSNSKGEPIWVNVTLTPIMGVNGRVSKMVSIDADITIIKKAEAEILAQKQEIEEQRDQLQDQRDYVLGQKDELEEQKEQLDQTLHVLQSTQKKLVDSEKMAALGSLVAGVAHEVNTPVGIGIAASSSMVTKTELLEESFTSKKMTMSELQNYLETTKQACDLIFSNLNRTAELVKSFKQVSIDNMTEQKRTFNFLEYLNDIVRSLGPKIKVRPVKMILDCPDNIVINSYPGSYYQIITNFINNSLMHAFDENEKGEMKVSVSIEKENLKIVYTDNGKGIPQENLKKVFDPFFTTNMQVGTGLGMNITYNIITQHLGGEVSLESTVGEGVKFTVTVPMEKLK